jgi:hypothetical protein
MFIVISILVFGVYKRIYLEKIFAISILKNINQKKNKLVTNIQNLKKIIISREGIIIHKVENHIKCFIKPIAVNKKGNKIKKYIDRVSKPCPDKLFTKFEINKYLLIFVLCNLTS